MVLMELRRSPSPPYRHSQPEAREGVARPTEDRNSRSFEASLTDSAMHGLGDVFGELFAQRGVGRATTPGGQRSLIKDTAGDNTKQLAAAAPTEPEQQQSTPRPSATRRFPI